MRSLKGPRTCVKSSPTPVRACGRLAFITSNVEALLVQRGVIVTRNRYIFGLIAAGDILLIAIARIAHLTNDTSELDAVVVLICGEKYWLRPTGEADGNGLDIFGENTLVRQSSKAVPATACCTIWRTKGGHDGQIMNRHQGDQTV